MLSLAVILMGVQARCQSTDDGFTPEVNGGVRAFAIQADGKMIIGGDFTMVNGFMRRGVARLNSDDPIDVEFLPGSHFVNGTLLC